MKKIFFEDSYFVQSLKTHNEYKNLILDHINNFVGLSIKTESQNISKSDWDIDSSVKRDWFETFIKFNHSEILNLYKDIGFENFSLLNWWFQQYENGDHHGWHIHPGCNFSNVYYLDMPDGTETTEFLLNNGKTIKADAKEGDLIVFPAHIKHRVKSNNSSKKRTVVVFNTNVYMS